VMLPRHHHSDPTGQARPSGDRSIADLRKELERRSEEFRHLHAVEGELDCPPTQEWWDACDRWLEAYDNLHDRLEDTEDAWRLIRRENAFSRLAYQSPAAKAFLDTRAGFKKPETPAEWGALAEATLRRDARERVLRRLVGKMLSEGVDPELVLALAHTHNQARCLPPLSGAEVERVVRWVVHRHVDRLEDAS
jgi:hypothetical protein